MATIKELFAKYGVENTALESEVSVLVSTAGSQNTGIPKDRFDAVIAERNELRADKAEFEATKANLENTITTQKEEIDNLKGIETQFKTFKDAENKRELDKWNERKKILAVDDSHAGYDKIQKIIRKFDMGDEITPEQAKANNNLFETYEEIDYFDKDDNNYPPGTKPGGTKSPKLNPFDLLNGVKGAFRDMAECNRLFRADPAKAKQLMESAGEYKE